MTRNFDSVFLFGDLNFRLNESRDTIFNWIDDTDFSRSHPILIENDQLHILLRDKIILQNFKEAPITFPPTYKYDVGSQLFDSSRKKRTPSYTDRILYRCKNIKPKIDSHNGLIQCLFYESVRSICSSDHKPVYGVYAVTL